MENDMKLVIEIKNKHQVELLDLTKSFLSLADEFKRYVSNAEEYLPLSDDVKLYVKEIKSGSIITELIALAPGALAFLENSNTIIGFASYLKTSFDYLLGKEEKKYEYDKNNYENLKNILEPIAKDNGSKINFKGSTIKDVIININLNSVQSNAVQNAASREILSLKNPTVGFHEKVLLYFYQARNDTKSNAGDKGIIESISKRPVKTIFINEMIKSKILSSSENPFAMGYVVDVSVETVEDRPALYNIHDIHEEIDLKA